jgi:hypothetical protein
MTAPTIAQAQRELDRLKLHIDLLDERYADLELTVPTVVVGKGVNALHASMVVHPESSSPPRCQHQQDGH